MRFRFVILFLLSAVSFFPVKGQEQELIGMPADSVRALVKINFPGFYENLTSTNTHFNYLKFEDQEGLQTLLVFLTKGDTCKYYKRICDYDLFKIFIPALNKKYTGKDSLWTYRIGDITYTKKLKKEKWFFTLTTRAGSNEEWEKE